MMTSTSVAYLTDRGPGQGRRTAPRARVNSDAPTLDLSGEWRFRLLPQAPGTPAAHGILPSGEAVESVAAVDFDDSAWDRIVVPSHWVLADEGRYGRPIYTNMVFPFPLDPPNVPDANPTGDYRRSFELPDGIAEAERVLLRFDGVESRYKVWVNGTEIGIGSGSRLAQEFDVTDSLTSGRNVLVVRVHQWSAASYLEDQDQWWLPGIFRDVTLLARPAGGIDDVWLTADFDAKTATGTLTSEVVASAASFPVTLGVPELGVEVTWASPRDVAPLAVGSVQPWSADVPRLYEVTLTSAAEQLSLRVGFRRVEIRGDIFTVNGRQVIFHGANRHETHPDRGRVFNEADARADLVLMKQFNVNAIRTSHYPPHPRVLDLADELGFWVILECDLETHGFGLQEWTGNPSDDPAWLPAYLDRIRRTVERDKNHPSIIMWSLGNESHTGTNLAAMSAWVHDRDPGRPVHYEGDYEGRYTDVYTRMYPTLAETASIGGDGTSTPLPACDDAQALRQRSKPYFHCEYAHAMGNGPGGILDYENLVDQFPRLHGGFVWEWRDHGLRSRTPGGVEFFAYGGDFGEVVHDGNFVMDGLLLSDRIPTPGLHEFKAVVAPVRVTLQPGSGGESVEVGIANMFHTASTAAYVFVWRVEHDGAVAASGELDVAVLAPGDQTAVTLSPLPVAADAETWLAVDVILREDAAWARAGHAIGGAQVDLSTADRETRRPVPPSAVDEAHAPAQLGPASFVGGRLSGLAGRPVGGLEFSLWRAPTDNDMRVVEAWQASGYDRLESRVESVGGTGSCLRVRTRHAAANRIQSFTTDVFWTEIDKHAVQLRIDLIPSAGWPAALPRLGVRLVLPESVDEVNWFGTGPHESYPDSRHSVRVGRFQARVDDLAVPYARPQESGHRSDLRALSISDAGSPWLSIRATPDARGRLPGFGINRNSPEEITSAAHPHQLPPSTGVHLTIDAGQRGLGSASCGPDVEPPYVLHAELRTIQLTFTGLTTQ